MATVGDILKFRLEREATVDDILKEWADQCWYCGKHAPLFCDDCERLPIFAPSPDPTKNVRFKIRRA